MAVNVLRFAGVFNIKHCIKLCCYVHVEVRHAADINVGPLTPNYYFLLYFHFCHVINIWFLF